MGNVPQNFIDFTNTFLVLQVHARIKVRHFFWDGPFADKLGFAVMTDLACLCDEKMKGKA
jgi:hypothetical protein